MEELSKWGGIIVCALIFLKWYDNQNDSYNAEGKVSVTLNKGEQWDLAGETVYLVEESTFKKAESIAKKVVSEGNKEIIAGRKTVESIIQNNNDLKNLTVMEIIAKALINRITDTKNEEYWSKVVQAGTVMLEADNALRESSLNCCKKIFGEINTYYYKTKTDGDGKYVLKVPNKDNYILVIKNERSRAGLSGEAVKADSFFWFVPVSSANYKKTLFLEKYRLPLQSVYVEHIDCDNTNLANDKYAGISNN